MEMETYVVFETWIAGQEARVEVRANASALNSRSEREKAELIARVAFRELSPAFVAGQPIKAVDIITLKPIDE